MGAVLDFALLRFAVWEAAFVNYQTGTVPEEIWSAWDGALRINSTGPGYKRFWDQAHAGHAPSFQSYIESEIDLQGGAQWIGTRPAHWGKSVGRSQWWRHHESLAVRATIP